MRKCTGCGWIEGNPFGLNAKGEEYLGCCPDSNYKEVTAMQEWTEWLKAYEYELPLELQIKAKELLEKEKDQLIKAYNDGYKACDLDEALEINKTMFNGEKYYIDNYKPETI